MNKVVEQSLLIMLLFVQVDKTISRTLYINTDHAFERIVWWIRASVSAHSNNWTITNGDTDNVYALGQTVIYRNNTSADANTMHRAMQNITHRFSGDMLCDTIDMYVNASEQAVKCVSLCVCVQYFEHQYHSKQKQRQPHTHTHIPLPDVKRIH